MMGKKVVETVILNGCKKLEMVGNRFFVLEV